MFEAVFLGSGFAFAAAMQPGPLQAFLVAQVAEKGWRRTLPASLSPLLSDGPVALVVLFFLKNFPAGLNRFLQVAGGLLLFYLAAMSFRESRRLPRAVPPEAGGKATRTILKAAAVNILNPNPYLGWALVLGPAAVSAWSKHPVNAVALVTSFYATMVASLAGTILLFGATGISNSKHRPWILLAASITLGALGLYRLLTGILATG